MLRVGLTGGIGCGKSRVAGLFASHGVPVLDADSINRELQTPGHDLYAAIVDRFGPGILDARGHLDRGALRSRIFADPMERQALEALVHPAVEQAIEERLAALSADTPYALVVVPLLFEAGWETRFDHVIVVHCEPGEQVARVTQRDGRSSAEVEAILEAQMDPGERRLHADSEIRNTEQTTEAELANQVAERDNALRQLAAATASRVEIRPPNT
ncbi:MULTISPECIES: dephospho-CoA kinase [unclassified Thioalkalivibrio]|uniref:dephospho-CoA kinase n=1 Tax=unclassified Thioalkalivibrio TaxID=2621013 RepID=UPI0003654ED9|nr:MULTISPECIES: dephospho-CoA kinase [unclassified Thioalkalivibrio]